MSNAQEQALMDNEYFECLGMGEDTCFVRVKRFDSVCKLTGKINQFMLNQIAPLSFWRANFPAKEKRGGLTASRWFLRSACAERGYYNEERIQHRKLWDTKRAEQPAPVIAESGLPTAFVVEDMGDRLRVKCPHCGELHVHGGPELGARVPHCQLHYGDLPNYELVRQVTARKKKAA